MSEFARVLGLGYVVVGLGFGLGVQWSWTPKPTRKETAIIFAICSVGWLPAMLLAGARLARISRENTRSN